MMKNKDQNKKSDLPGGKSSAKTAGGAKKPKKAAKKRDKSLIALWVLAGILALGLVAFGVVMAVRAIYGSYLDSGDKYRNDVIFESEHHSLNAAMLSYRYNENIRNGVYGTNYTDPELLKKTESLISGVSQYEYYERALIESLLRQMRYAEKASENGLTLNETEEARIKAHLQSIETSLLGGDATLDERLSAVYGRGVKMSDIEDMLRLEALADKQKALYETSVGVSGDEIDEYLKTADLSSYLRTDYYIVDFGNNIYDSDDAATKALKEQLAFERAEQLSKMTNEEAFTALAKELFRREFQDEDLSDDEIDEMLEDDHYVGKELPDIPDDAPESTLWLFSSERKAGDIYVETTSPTVYFIAKPFYSIDAPNDAYLVINVDYDNYATRSAALDALNAVVRRYEEGEKTEQAFRALARDCAENNVFAQSGGFYDDTSSISTFNSLIGNYISALTARGEELLPGLTFTLYGEEGAYCLYYLGKGELRSRVEAREAIVTNKCYDLYAALAKEDKIVYHGKTGVRSADRYEKN